MFNLKFMLFSFLACFEMDMLVIVLFTENLLGVSHYLKEPETCRSITIEGCNLRTVFQRRRIVLKENFFEKSERLALK